MRKIILILFLLTLISSKKFLGPEILSEELEDDNILKKDGLGGNLRSLRISTTVTQSSSIPRVYKLRIIPTPVKITPIRVNPTHVNTKQTPIRDNPDPIKTKSTLVRDDPKPSLEKEKPKEPITTNITPIIIRTPTFNIKANLKKTKRS